MQTLNDMDGARAGFGQLPPTQPPGHPPGQPPAAAPPKLEWEGPTWGLAGLGLLNTFLSLITLGIYGFWGRTEVRKRVWSSIHLNGEPLAYTGTGKELFLGFLIVFIAILVPMLILIIGTIVAFGPKSPAQSIVQIVLGIGFIYLGGVASYRARRYRMSRTAWRGIRGSLEGSSGSYGWATFWTTMAIPLIFLLLIGIGYVANFGFGPPNLPTQAAQQAFFVKNGIWIGLLYFFFIVGSLLIVPWRTTKLTRHITNDMAFGSLPFAFTGSSKPLYARFIARWVGVLLLFIATPAAIYFWIGSARMTAMAVGSQTRQPVPMTSTEVVGLAVILLLASVLYSILTAWYKARELNYFASVTSYNGQPFRLGVTARGLIWLVLSNAPLTLFTLGILRPVAQARTAKYIVENMSLDGPIDFHAIAQSSAQRSKTGEGLAQAFDVDAF
jgi:uncharacterized membrane protein YjgN (DUF898 family)